MGTLLARVLAMICLVGLALHTSSTAAVSTQPSRWYIAMERGAVTLVDPGTKQLFTGAHAGTDLALSPDQTRVFVTSWDALGVLDASTLGTLSTLSATDKRQFGRFAISPDGTRAAVGTGGASEVLFFDLSTERWMGSVSIAQPGLITTGGIAYSPDGRLVYAAVSPYGPLKGNGALVVINAATFQVENTIVLRGPVRHVALTAAGNTGYVASGRHLHEIDLVERSLRRSVDLDIDAHDVALAPDQLRAYVIGNETRNGDGPWLIAVELDRYAIAERRQLAACGIAQRVAIAPDGRSLVALIDQENVMIIVDLEAGTTSAFRTPEPPRAVVPADASLSTGAAISPGDPLLAVPDDQLFSCDATIAIDDVSGAPGEAVDVAVSIQDARDPGIAGIQNEIIFDPRQIVLESERACSIDPSMSDDGVGCDNPDLGVPCKQLFAARKSCSDVRCPTGLDEWALLRGLVVSLSNTNSIPVGTVYRCRFRIPADAMPGTSIPLLCNNVGASTPDGHSAPVICNDGRVSVVAREDSPTPAPSPTATAIAVQQPRDQVASDVTTTTFKGGCQVARTDDSSMWPLHLLLPLLTIPVRAVSRCRRRGQ